MADAPTRQRLLAPLVLALLVSGCLGPQVGRTVDTSLPGSRKTSVTEVREAGPFYEHVETSDGDVRTSVRPLLYTHIEAPKDQSTLTEVLWPVYTSRTDAERLNWRFLTIYGRNADTNDTGSAWHVWGFPFWFQGRSEDGHDYAALFPLAGTTRDFLMFDRFSFALWPLWSSADRHGIHSTYVFWPFFSKSEGMGRHSLRLWPFWGRSVKDGAWYRRFVLWPLWNEAEYFKDGEPDGSAWCLIPVFGHTDRPAVEAWHILPPFFQVSRGRGRFEGDRQILAPWPFVRISDFRDTHKRHFYPFYATTREPGSVRTSILWPFYSSRHGEDGDVLRDDWSLAPLFHRTRVRKTTGDGTPEPVRSYTRLWPLFSYVDEADGRFFRLLDFSLHRRVGALERNLLQMPVVYTHGSADGMREDELLWGLFRWRRDDTATRDLQFWPFYRRIREDAERPAEWRVLWGLFGRENTPEGEGRRTRLLWFLAF